MTEYVECYFDLQNIGSENVLDTFKKVFGKQLIDSNLHYEMFVIDDDDDPDTDSETNSDSDSEYINNNQIEKQTFVGGSKDISSFPYRQFERIFKDV